VGAHVGRGMGGRLFAPLRCFLTNDEELYGKMSPWMSPPRLIPYNTRGFAGTVGNIFISLRSWVRGLETIAFHLTPKIS
jgi:hypothetical protein